VLIFEHVSVEDESPFVDCQVSTFLVGETRRVNLTLSAGLSLNAASYQYLLPNIYFSLGCLLDTTSY
jgi:hypothetical protein